MAAEMEAAPQYASYFGSTAPDPAKIAERLHVASSWDEQYDAAFAWMRYTLAMRMFAWNSALGSIGMFKETFAPVIRRSDAAANLYPQTAQFFGVRTAMAARGTKTKTRKAKPAAKTA